MKETRPSLDIIDTAKQCNDSNKTPWTTITPTCTAKVHSAETTSGTTLTCETHYKLKKIENKCLMNVFIPDTNFVLIRINFFLDFLS